MVLFFLPSESRWWWLYGDILCSLLPYHHRQHQQRAKFVLLERVRERTKTVTFDMRKWEKVRVAEASRRVKVIFFILQAKGAPKRIRVRANITFLLRVCFVCTNQTNVFGDRNDGTKLYRQWEREIKRNSREIARLAWLAFFTTCFLFPFLSLHFVQWDMNTGNRLSQKISNYTPPKEHKEIIARKWKERCGTNLSLVSHSVLYSFLHSARKKGLKEMFFICTFSCSRQKSFYFLPFHCQSFERIFFFTLFPMHQFLTDGS